MAKKKRVVAPPSPIEKLISPFQEFANLEASGGLLLIASTLIALIWANSPLGKSYEELWYMKAGLQVGGYGLFMSISHWINDGIMAIFFFVVGLEIKREVGTGELNSIRKAALPFFGALGGMAIPSRPRINSRDFLSHGRQFLDEFEHADTGDDKLNETQESALQALETAVDHTESVLHRMEHGLHPWVMYFIIPLFALANAGVYLGEGIVSALTHPIGLGILAGLALGKPLGIVAFTWLAVKAKLTQLPERITWRHLIGAGMLAGIGFTMSLFITALAFTDAEAQTIAKVGILLASVIAGLAGYAILWTAPKTESP